MTAVRVPWSSASFLAYLGGFTILFATGSLLSVQSSDHGAAGLVLWALLSSWPGRGRVGGSRAAAISSTAGLLALSVVISFVTLLGALLDWFGWFPDRPIRPSSRASGSG